MDNYSEAVSSQFMPRSFAMSGGSAIEVVVLGIVILASSIAYIIWLIKRKL